MNMIVGHILLKTMAGFVYSLGLGGVVPLLVVGMLMLFEMFIAFLQAYVFTLLTSLYIGQAIHSH
jgi:F-type H+-transporting ATPase subunit a